MRTAGYAFLVLGFAAGFLWHFLGRNDVWPIVVFGVSMIVGLLSLSIDAIIRMYRGELRLRPFDAFRKAPIIFTIVFAILVLTGMFFRTAPIDWTQTLIKCAVISLVMAFYLGAYRKTV